MSGRQARAGIVLGVLAAVTIVGCARMSEMMGGKPRVGSGDVIGDRQRLMKLQGASLTDIRDKIRAGNIEAVAVNADTILLTATHIPALFPQGSLGEKSRAKPEIWQKWSEFEEAATSVQVTAEKLREAARAKDAEATQAGFRQLGDACDACHTPFRVPRRQS
jgi:cytochrome c556